jgi:hypothetical protein
MPVIAPGTSVPKLPMFGTPRGRTNPTTSNMVTLCMERFDKPGPCEMEIIITLGERTEHVVVDLDLIIGPVRRVVGDYVVYRHAGHAPRGTDMRVSFRRVRTCRRIRSAPLLARCGLMHRRK